MRKKKFLVKNFVVLLAVAAVLVVIFFSFNGVFSVLREGVLFAGYPFQKFFQLATDNSVYFFKTVATIRDLAKENKRLEAENLRLFSENAQMMMYKRENETLRDQLGLSIENTAETKLFLARVIGRDPQKSDYYFFIDKGEKDGIKKDDPVMIGNVLVGFVSETFSRNSQVVSLFTAHQQVNVFVQSIEGARLAEGVLKNDLNSGLFIDLIVKDVNVSRDSLVIDAATGFIIGAVEEVSGSDADVFQKIKIKPAVDYGALETVFVVILPD